jgi:hypothetical protein
VTNDIGFLPDALCNLCVLCVSVVELFAEQPQRHRGHRDCTEKAVQIELFTLTAAPPRDRLSLRVVPGCNKPRAPLQPDQDLLPERPADRVSAMME